MKRKLLHVLTVGIVVLTGSLVAGAPAAASDGPGLICLLNQNTWLRATPDGQVLLTLSAGRGFRWHTQGMTFGTGSWFYGHGAEAPSVDGWVPAANVYGCYWP